MDSKVSCKYSNLLDIKSKDCVGTTVYRPVNFTSLTNILDVFKK